MFFDPWDKAGECTEAIKISSDLELRTLLDATRDSWIKLANQRPLLTDTEFADQAARIGRIHSHLIPT